MYHERQLIFLFSGKKAAAAFIAATVFILSIILAVSGSGFDLKYVIICSAAAVLGIAVIFMDFFFSIFINGLLMTAVPVISFVLLENFTNSINQFSVQIILLNLIFYFLFYGFLSFLLGNTTRGYYAATVFVFLFGLVNYFVFSFRGSPIVPWDFYSVKTAFSVAGHYDFTISWKACCSIFLFVWLLIMLSKTITPRKRMISRFLFSAVFLCAILFYTTSLQSESVRSYFRMDTRLFMLNDVYKNNGTVPSFLMNLGLINIEEPEGYSPEAADLIAKAYKSNGEISREKDIQNYPNIIVIMNEAFSDLSVYGNFSVNEDVLANFRQLQQEGISGNVYVSVKGGNTANTEYEFLTGNTMAFLPSGSVPYQQYINDDMPSLAAYLGSIGYETIAIHPFSASGWNRNKVYDYFGFDSFLSIDDFIDPYMIRGLVSDQSAYEKIAEQYENKTDDSRLFIFEVTMQNHGDYIGYDPDFLSYVEISDVSSSLNNYPSVNEYLTLICESDKAFRWLCDYFSNEAEHTVILMFGDHQPADYVTDAVRELCGDGKTDTLGNVQLGYCVPFIIWANYEITKEYYDGISANYLSTVLLKTAKVPLNGYQEYLNDLMQNLPIINAKGYCDDYGNFYELHEKESSFLKDYQILNYNNLFDSDRRIFHFFM